MKHTHHKANESILDSLLSKVISRKSIHHFEHNLWSTNPSFVLNPFNSLEGGLLIEFVNKVIKISVPIMENISSEVRSIALEKSARMNANFFIFESTAPK